VYMLRCNDGSLYTGCTNDLDARLKTHNQGKGAKYTRSRLPCDLVYQEPCSNRSHAARREYAIKKLSAAAKHQLIDQDHPDTE
jgi:predicted GIY-YIG superfamily endonuclease